MDDQQKNLILATALSFLVIFVWFILFPPPPPGPAPADLPVAEDGTLTPPAAAPSDVVELQPREDALDESARVAIETPRLIGSVSLRGGRIDDLRLTDYRVSLADDAEIVTLLSPSRTADPYYAVHGWAPGAGGGLSADLVPGALTEWSAAPGAALSIGQPLELTWDNGAGLLFTKTIEVDANYMFTVTQTVENSGDTAQRLYPYAILARRGEPELRRFFILHEGLIRAADGELSEEGYGAMRDFPVQAREGTPAETVSAVETAWIGFTDHYWMTTLVAPNATTVETVAKYVPQIDTYQTELRYPAIEVEPGAVASQVSYVFAGAKEWEQIRAYQNQLGIGQFVDAIDWGWFAFLTKPIFIALHYLNLWIGNMGWAILALTLVIKTILFPLAWKSYVSMARMKELQPEMEKIKERVGDDRQKLQQEMMQLYKDKKVNPAAGCLPILVQIPIFFSLYKVIFVTIELRHAPWFGWVTDLSAPDPSSFMNLFGLMPWGTPGPESLFAIFSIGVLPILMGFTMWIQMKLNPAPTDPTQAMVFAWMPWIFMFMLGTVASGLVLYWSANNVITFSQQYIIMRSQGVKPDIFGNILSSFRRKKPAE
ncbi:MAG: membrane protein insertase YidC [Pseudomonadota bacterium]